MNKIHSVEHSYDFSLGVVAKSCVKRHARVPRVQRQPEELLNFSLRLHCFFVCSTDDKSDVEEKKRGISPPCKVQTLL